MARQTRITPKPMDDQQLKSVIRGEINYAIGYHGGELSEQRRTAMELYYGEPLGNEIEGRSQVVMSDTMDTVEWIMPSLMRTFFSGNDVVKFEPEGEEDVDAAEQKTDYCNHVFLKDNNGFEIAYDWIKDGLLQKTGVLKCVWDDTPQRTRSTHTGLDMLDLGKLLQAKEGEKIEVVEQREYEVDEDDDDTPDLDVIGDASGYVDEDDGAAPMPPAGMALSIGQGDDAEVMPFDPRKRFDVSIIRTQTRGRVKIECVPPEEFLLSRRAVDADTATFSGHRYKITVSEAREMGFDEEDIEACTGQAGEGEYNEERLARHDIDEEWPDQGQALDPAQRELWIIEGYYLVDYDGDGLTERRQIITGGENHSVILSNEVVDDHPWVWFSPIRIPHKFHGLGMADLVADLQRIRSTVVRQLLDHMYNVNSGRAFISDKVNVDDWLANRPNQAVRVKLGVGETIAQHAQPIRTEPIGQFAYPLLEFLDSEKIGRTGINKYQQGLDAEALNKTATGSARIMAAANSRIELIARLLAEGGFVRLFRRIATLTTNNQDKARTIRLRGQWVDVDPKSWSESMDMTAQVGLGYDTKEQEGAMVGQLLSLMEKAMGYQGGLQGPFVFPEHLHNAFERFIKASGFRSVDMYFEDPKTQRAQAAWQAMMNKPPPPNPELLKIQGQQQLDTLKLQNDGRKIQMEAQQDMQQMQMDAALAREKAAAEVQVAREKAEAEIQLAMAKANAEINIEREKLGLEREKLVINAQIKRTEIETSAAIERDRMQTDAAVRDRDSERNARNAAMAGANAQRDSGKAQPPVTVVVEGAKQSGVRINRGPDGKIIGASPEAAE